MKKTKKRRREVGASFCSQASFDEDGGRSRVNMVPLFIQVNLGEDRERNENEHSAVNHFRRGLTRLGIGIGWVQSFCYSR